VADELEEEKKSFRLPLWVKEWGMKLLPWALMGIISANIGLIIDNERTKKDVARNTWRMEQIESRQNRFEARQDRFEATQASMQDTQNEFQYEAINRLDEILKLKDRKFQR
jgi:hypothetical protein